MKLSRQKIVCIIAAAVLLLTAAVHIVQNKVSVQAIQMGSTLTVVLDEPVPSGDYTLHYYIVASTTDTSAPALEFSLQADTAYMDMRSYTAAVGFGASDLRIEENQVIAAVFTHPENDKEAATYAAVGDVYLQSKDGRFQKRLYTPSAGGKKPIENPRLSLYPSELSENISVTPFATITGYATKNGALVLDFLCTEDTLETYEIGLKIETDNVNSIRPDGVRYSFHKLTQPEEGGWIKGEAYKQTIGLNLAPGNYNFDLLIQPRDTENTHNVKVSQLADNPNKLSLGSITVNGQTLADYINRLQDGQIIFISIKDDGSSALNALSKNALASLGLQEDLSGKYRWSYLAVAAKGIEGFVPYENLSQEHIQHSFLEGSMLGTFALPVSVDMESAGYEVGNLASIRMGDKDYAKNARGLNIVVYDLLEGKVVDQAVFDTCARNFRYLQ